MNWAELRSLFPEHLGKLPHLALWFSIASKLGTHFDECPTLGKGLVRNTLFKA